MADLHPVKTERFYLHEGINIDPKGYRREVDTYTITDFGLYMARGADHPEFGYMESWLLPAVHLRVTIFHYRPHIQGRQSLYIDIVDIDPQPECWTTRDLYIDILSYSDARLEVEDEDELDAAAAAGYISHDEASTAREWSRQALSGIEAHHNNVEAWLASCHMPLSWAESVELCPPMA